MPNSILNKKGKNEEDNDGKRDENEDGDENGYDDDDDQHVLEQMQRMGEALKANKQNPTKLGAELFEISKNLKIRGKRMEKKHRAELDKFFASLRQASCRDSADLGLPCRLKVMEVLELRGMGWRPNLSNAQYYAKREKEMEKGIKRWDGVEMWPTPGSAPTSSATHSAPAIRDDSSPVTFSPQHHSRQLVKNNFCAFPSLPPTAAMLAKCASTPVPDNSASSASAAVPPFPFHQPFRPNANAPPFIPSLPPPPIFPSPPPQSQQFISHGPIPPKQTPTGAIPFNFYQHQQMAPTNFVPNLFGGIGTAGNGEMLLGTRPTSNSRQLQLREETVIRNSDSGKVMGVKGRRVALIEELTGTVISFQRVDPKCKERQLVIIGEHRGAIESAKKLIKETIERNVSPERKNGTERESGKGEAVGGEMQEGRRETTKTDGQEAPYRIEKDTDGSLKIAAQDPALLEAIREALDKHLMLKEKKPLTSVMDEEDEEGTGESMDNTGGLAPSSSSRKPIGDEGGLDTERRKSPFVYDRDQLLRIRNNHNWEESIDRTLMCKLIDSDLLFPRKM